MRTSGAAALPFRSWIISYECSVLPLAMAPVSFGLAAYGATGSSQLGAALMAASTCGQVLFALPLEAATRRFRPARLLATIQVGQATVLLGLLSALLGGEPTAVVLGLGVALGAPNGLVFGLYRVLLAEMTPRGVLVRRIATSLTVNELCYVAGPIAAALLSLQHAMIPLGVMAASCAGGAFSAMRLDHEMDRTPSARRARLGPAVRAWLACMFLSSLALAYIEVGAVAISLEVGFPASASGFLAAGACVASAAAGTWVSIAQTAVSTRGIFAMLAVTLAGTLSVTTMTPALVLAGAVLIGVTVAPLGTYLSVRVHDALPADALGYAFSILRLAHGCGLAVVSLLLALLSPQVAAASVALFVVVVGGWASASLRRSV